MRIVFMGTPDFALPSLNALHEKHEIAAVITQPDAQRDRGKAMMPPPVKVRAAELGIKVYQFERLSAQGVETLKALKPDFLVTAAFGQILSAEVLQVAPCINVHASLLPRWRGAAPIERAIMAGDAETGVTTMLTDVGLDTGDMLLSERTEIDQDETGECLRKRLAEIGARLIVLTIEEFDCLKRIPQDGSKATVARSIKKTEGQIDFSLSALEVKNKVRALAGMFGAYFVINGQRVKVFGCRVSGETGTAGEVLCAKKRFIVSCGDKSVEITDMQLEGKKRMRAADALNGFKVSEGDRADA